MELYGLKKVTLSDTESHEVHPYTLEKAIHAGKSNIRILKAVDSTTKKTVAIKLFPKSKSRKPMPNFFSEERSASKLSHPHILKYYNFYEDALIQLGKDEFKEYSAIVMEYIPYGDLFGLVSQRSVSEKFARTIFKQILSAVRYLHSENLAHLDIKLENVLLDVNGGAKVIDFDACEPVTKDGVKTNSSNKGSAGYRAPEFVKGNVENLLAGDVYSLGIVLFILVLGTPPYNEIEKNGKYAFDKHYELLRSDVKKFWKVHENYRDNDGRSKLTKNFKDVIEAMLKEDPKKRPTIFELERLPWFQADVYNEDELEAKLKSFYEK